MAGRTSSLSRKAPILWAAHRKGQQLGAAAAGASWSRTNSDLQSTTTSDACVRQFQTRQVDAGRSTALRLKGGMAGLSPATWDRDESPGAASSGEAMTGSGSGMPPTVCIASHIAFASFGLRQLFPDADTSVLTI